LDINIPVKHTSCRLRRSGLMTSTFDLLTSKWGLGSSLSWVSFLPIFSLLCPSILDSGSGTGRIDGQTSIRPSMYYNLQTHGAGYNKSSALSTDYMAYQNGPLNLP